MKMHVAAVQLQAVWGDKTHNLQTVERIAAEAAQSGVNFLVLPELWNSGYDTRYFSQLPEQAEDLNGASVSFLKDLARRYKLSIGGGSLVEARHGKLYNTSLFIDPKGEILAKYRKTHLFGEEKDFFSPGDEWTIVSDEQNFADFSIGMAICYDLRFPELFRNMALRGCRMFTLPVAWPISRREEYVVMSRARAIENRALLVSANLIAADGSLSGSSMVISPVGRVLASCQMEEGYAAAVIETEEVFDPNKFNSINDRRQFLDEIDDNLL